MPDDVPQLAALPDPRFRFFADLSVQVGPPQEVGATAHGGRRLIPILGGTARGDGWSARVLPGGADFQRIVHGGLAELDARYVLETDAGDLIYVCNQALRSGDPAHMARLARGEPVDPAHISSAARPAWRRPAGRWAGSTSACSSAPARAIPIACRCAFTSCSEGLPRFDTYNTGDTTHEQPCIQGAPRRRGLHSCRCAGHRPGSRPRPAPSLLFRASPCACSSAFLRERGRTSWHACLRKSCPSNGATWAWSWTTSRALAASSPPARRHAPCLTATR